MKTIFILFTASCIITSCASMRLVQSPSYQIASEDNPILYEYDGETSVGSPKGNLPVRKGEKVQLLNGLKYDDAIIPRYFVVQHQGKKYCILYSSLMSEKYARLETMPTKFSAPKSKDTEIWSRASYYITKHSTMKVQTSTDYLIETYNPRSNDIYGAGFRITKLAQGDNFQYEVVILGYNTELQAQRCVYYMQTGSEYEL